MVIAEIDVPGTLLAFVVVLIGPAILPTDVERVFPPDPEEVVFENSTELAVDRIGIR